MRVIFLREWCNIFKVFEHCDVPTAGVNKVNIGTFKYDVLEISYTSMKPCHMEAVGISTAPWLIN